MMSLLQSKHLTTTASSNQITLDKEEKELNVTEMTNGVSFIKRRGQCDNNAIIARGKISLPQSTWFIWSSWIQGWLDDMQMIWHLLRTWIKMSTRHGSICSKSQAKISCDIPLSSHKSSSEMNRLHNILLELKVFTSHWQCCLKPNISIILQ